MARLIIEMHLDNAEFEGENLGEGVAASLMRLADRISDQNRSYLALNGSRMRVADSNGNTIGYAAFDVESQEVED